jgi:hypothetical protein
MQQPIKIFLIASAKCLLLTQKSINRTGIFARDEPLVEALDRQTARGPAGTPGS